MTGMRKTSDTFETEAEVEKEQIKEQYRNKNKWERENGGFSKSAEAQIR